MRTYSKWYWNKGKDGVYRPKGVCTICGQEYSNENIGASSYCPECAAKVKREKTAERVRKYRERQNAGKQTQDQGEG
jgi:predicted Zn-ribbon and HTH transcriptional regulator